MDYKPDSNNILNGIKYGITYFTTLPIKLNYFDANKKFYQGVLLSLPIVGIILSSIIILFYSILPFHALYSAFISSILYLFLTGFLHYEAVGDTIDGWYASLSNKNIYEVMHEPQIGSIGVMGMISFLLLEIVALVYCFYEELFIVIILSFALSRISVYFALSFEFHKKSKFIIYLKENKQDFKFLTILLFPIKLITDYILRKLQQRLGFLNGDTLGFLIVFLEIILLNIGLLSST